MSKYDKNYDWYNDAAEGEIERELGSSSKPNNSFVKFPITYVGQEGTYIFRLYPEMYKGKPRFERSVRYNKLHNHKKVVKVDNRIDDLIKEAQERKLDTRTSDGFWPHKSRVDTILMAYLISAPNGKYVQPAGTATALILNYKQASALELFFDDIKGEGRSSKDFLNPTMPRNALKLTIKNQEKGKKNESIVYVSSTTSSDYELPPLDEVLPQGIEFTGLDDIYIKSDQVITDEEFADFKTYYDDKVNTILNSRETYDLEDDESEKGYQVSFNDGGK